MAASPTTSIHHQRRWYYVLWSVLLLSGLALYGRWLTPLRVERPLLGIAFEEQGLPPETVVEVWTGPTGQWRPKPAASPAGFRPLPRNGKGQLAMGATELPMAIRRWVKPALIPARSHDLVVLRFTLPGQDARFLFLSLREDWQTGLLRPGKRLYYTIRPKWDALRTDPALPPELG